MIQERMILLTAFDGEDKPGRWCSLIDQAVQNIRKYMDHPIVLMTDNPGPYMGSIDYITHTVKGICKGHERHCYRSSNYWRVKHCLLGYGITWLYIDLDIRIIHPAFVKGFDLAERFGFCMPPSPRAFACIENTKGVDAIGRQDKQAEFDSIYSHATSYITGVMFMNAAVGNAKSYIETYVGLFETEPQRGPSIAIKAAINSGFAPYVLPPQWCVTYHNMDMIANNRYAKALALHIGDEAVAEKFKDLL